MAGIGTQLFAVVKIGAAGVDVVTISGEVDLDAVEQLWEALEQQMAPGTVVIAECSGITFLDSVGLQALVRAQHWALEVGAQFRLRAPSEPVTRVLRLAGLAGLFTVDAADGTTL